MINIDLLKNHPNCIPVLAKIWYKSLGEVWFPEISLTEIDSWCNEWCNTDLPLAYIALEDNKPIGMCSLQANDGIRPDLCPWLGDLCVDVMYRKQGVGKLLIDATKEKAKALGFNKLYLFTFDFSIPAYYARLGWETIGNDTFENKPVIIMQIILNQTF